MFWLDFSNTGFKLGNFDFPFFILIALGRTLFRDLRHVVEFLLQLENKQQIMPNNVETN